MARKTRKNFKKKQRKYLDNQNKDAKKGTQLKCRLKTCRSKKYQSIYGASVGGSIRTERQIFL